MTLPPHPAFRTVPAALALLSLTAIVLVSCARQAPSPAETLPVIAPAPAFSAVNYDGRTITSADLAGHPYIVEFIFTTCTGPCPVMNSTANVLQAEFAGLQDFRIVSFTVDPETDTIDRLSRTAERYGAKKDRWYFLRTDERTVATLASKGFLMGDPDNPMLHSTRYALVDRRGMIRGYYDALDAGRVDSLRRAIRIIEKERA